MKRTHSIPRSEHDKPSIFLSLIRVPQKDVENPDLAGIFNGDLVEDMNMDGFVAMTAVHPLMFASIFAKTVMDMPSNRFMISKIIGVDFDVNYLFCDFDADKEPIKFENAVVEEANVSLLRRLVTTGFLNENSDGDVVLNYDALVKETDDLYGDHVVMLSMAASFAAVTRDAMDAARGEEDAKLSQLQGTALLMLIKKSVEMLLEKPKFEEACTIVNNAFDDFNRINGMNQLDDL